MDFLQLFGKMDLHPGLIVLVPNVVPALQRAVWWVPFNTCREGSGKHRVEVTLKAKTLHCVIQPAAG